MNKHNYNKAVYNQLKRENVSYEDACALYDKLTETTNKYYIYIQHLRIMENSISNMMFNKLLCKEGNKLSAFVKLHDIECAYKAYIDTFKM